jgi:pimeloyl-ACP methyl ester carboxylesterase
MQETPLFLPDAPVPPAPPAAAPSPIGARPVSGRQHTNRVPDNANANATANGTGAALVYREARGTGDLPCWMALPSDPLSDAPPLVAVHGIQRGARGIARRLLARAAAARRPVIAPLFEKTDWPRYQQVVRKGRADWALLSLLYDLRMDGLVSGDRFDLHGHSGGAQFAHRFAMLYPHRIRRLTVGAAGWYTVPDETPFPLGLGVTVRNGRLNDWGPRMAARLDTFLRLPIQIYVGARDNQPDDATRRSPELDRQQGEDRLTRARHWQAALRSAAEARGIAPRIDLMIIPDAGHGVRTCLRHPTLARRLLPDAPADRLTIQAIAA